MTDTANTPVLRARGLRKDYGKGEGRVHAVDGIDLDAGPGETVAVMGPSGCGKSTLLHLLGLSAAQLLPALAGAVLGIPSGIGLYGAVKHGGTMTYPPLWWLPAVVVGILLVVAALTTIPARIGARRPVAEILRSELA